MLLITSLCQVQFNFIIMKKLTDYAIDKLIREELEPFMQNDPMIYQQNNDPMLNGPVQEEPHETLDKDDKLYTKLENIIKGNKQRISLDSICGVKDINPDGTKNDEYGYYIAKFYGGLNGSGKWKNYVDEIKKLFTSLKDSWLIDLENDCCDDVWVLRIGFRK